MVKIMATAGDETIGDEAIEESRPMRIVRGTVARGRTVMAPDGTKKKVIGHHPVTFEPLTTSVLRAFGPGQEVELPEDEMAWLRETGHIVDPNKIIPASNTPARLETHDKANVGFLSSASR